MNFKRTGLILKPDPARVLFRPLNWVNDQRRLRILTRVLTLSEAEVHETLTQVKAEFHTRHQRLHDYFLRRYEAVHHLLPTDQPLSESRKHLLGAYFAHEYSLEAAALFNPSIVPHPDQTNLPEGSLRYVLSLRATGEGHISSITFRSGTIDAQGNIGIDPATRYVTAPAHIPPVCYDKPLFWRKLRELGVADPSAETILNFLPENFTGPQLILGVEQLRRQVQHQSSEFERSSSRVINLALSNYEVIYQPEQPLSERVIFPHAPNESNGIEDARFVRFVEDDGQAIYLATYTAYDGRLTIPQILETTDFLHFRVSTLNGPEVQNKGMAIFPRKINGRYVTLSRQDGENLYLMVSDNLHFWNAKVPLLKPTYAWEFVQIGNCGSPIETEAGWLVISHGVGPMRKYSIGAFLLDLEDPSKVIGRLRQPMLSPDENEREGYVPNVVYSCGALVHHGLLILPYAMSDTSSTFGTIPVSEILAAMQ